MICFSGSWVNFSWYNNGTLSKNPIGNQTSTRAKMIPCLRMETLKNHLPYRRSRKTFPQTSLAARSEYRRLCSQTAICSNGKRKLIPQNPGYKPRHGYRFTYMFLSSQSRLLILKWWVKRKRGGYQYKNRLIKAIRWLYLITMFLFIHFLKTILTITALHEEIKS